MISKALFEQIPDDDWRKETWIAPEDAGKAPGTKYHTLFTDENLKSACICSFKIQAEKKAI